MFKRLKKRDAFNRTQEFLRTAIEVHRVMREIRPASAHRVEQAGIQMLHFIIHSDGEIRKRRGQWRISRAIAAGTAAHIILRRLKKVPEHRILVGVALETLERALVALNEEMRK